MNSLNEIGFTRELENYVSVNKLDSFTLGRITRQYRNRYVVLTEKGEFDAEITGNLRYTANDAYDFPAVGDWVALLTYESLYLIQHLLPRKTLLERRAIGKFGETQLIAANIDFALIVQSVDNDYSLNGMERYISICHTGNIIPIIILNKVDLIPDKEIEHIIKETQNRVGQIRVLATSIYSDKKICSFKSIFEKGKTYCLIGSSGVGKSSLTNLLMGHEHMKISKISDATLKGKHITSHRELLLLDNGSILIDTPGMRELGVLDDTDGIHKTFSDISELAGSCRFDNCTHTDEPGCAVRMAVENGQLSASEYENFLKLERESQRLRISREEKRKKERAFGRLQKEAVKIRKRNKY